MLSESLRVKRWVTLRFNPPYEAANRYRCQPQMPPDLHGQVWIARVARLCVERIGMAPRQLGAGGAARFLDALLYYAEQLC